MLTGTVRGNVDLSGIRHAVLRVGNPTRQASPYSGANALDALKLSSGKLLPQTADALAQEVTLCSQKSRTAPDSERQPNLNDFQNEGWPLMVTPTQAWVRRSVRVRRRRQGPHARALSAGPP